MSNRATEVIQAGYNISITGRHLMVSDAMKQYATDKLAKLERIAHRIIDVHVIMDIQKLEHKVDIVIKFNHIKIKVHAFSEDMYTSIDRAIDKLQNQIRRYKERLHAHQAKGLSIVEMNVDVLSSRSIEDNVNEAIEDYNSQELVERYRPHTVVKQEVRPLKILTQEEAVMKMDLSQDSFMIYQDEISHKLKVIYRRLDDNYAVIETER